MCIPNNAASFVESSISTITDAVNSVSDYKKQRAELNYRRQIALKNMQEAHNQALEETQKGIDESRKIKIDSMNSMAKQIARNAASGFSLDSKTDVYQYRDIYDKASSDAKTIEDKYNSSAQNYFDRANDYLVQSKNINDDYNSSLFNAAMGLGKNLSVTSNWYYKWKKDKK